jgi:MATE family multidrug resistance protein
MAARLLKTREEAGALTRLAGPLIVNNLSIAGMNFADAVMAGRLGADALAAVAVGGSIWFLSFTLILGVLMAISPIAARHFGANRPDLIGRYTRQGIYIAVVFGVLVILFGRYLAGPILVAVGIDSAFRGLTIQYVASITLGAPAIFTFLALRFTTEGLGRTKPIMYTSVLALASNVFFNYVLMFGKFGFPALGVVGCGLASAITMWLVMAALAWHMLRSAPYKPLAIFSKLAPPRPQVLWEIIALGVPIAVMVTAEAGLFNAVSILVGTRGTSITAAHQIAINFAATMFMVPLAFSSAITVRVGQLLGADKLHEARQSGAIGITICAGFMFCAAMILLVFREAVVGLYTSDTVVRDIAISLLLMASIFQVADGVQIGAAGALRGYKDTRMPMAINIVSYWVIAFPLAYLAAVTYKMPANYIWGGFVVGLSVAAVFLSWRYARVSRHVLADGVI